jgi:hypothetical protein
MILVGLVAALPAAAAAQPISPRALLPLHVACADLPVGTTPTIALTVAGAQRGDGREVLATGDVAVLRAGTAQGLAVGQQFVARRLDGGRAAFRRGANGFAGVRTAGVLEITAVDTNFALARIARACDHVQVGDYLEPLALSALPAPAAPGAPIFADRATRRHQWRRCRRPARPGPTLSGDRGTRPTSPGARPARQTHPAARRGHARCR